MTDVFIGIDPGASGGAAVIDDAGTWLGDLAFDGASSTDLLVFLREFQARGQARAVIERVASSPQMGVKSAFSFGQSYGAQAMALVAVGIPFDRVSPRTWQPTVGVLYPPKSEQTVKKNISKRRAQELFPAVKVTHAIADALLIAEHCRRAHRGEAASPKEQ